MSGNAVPVLEFRCFLQKLKAWMGQQDAGHHGLEVIWSNIPAPLLSENVKHAPYRVHLHADDNLADDDILKVFQMMFCCECL